MVPMSIRFPSRRGRGPLPGLTGPARVDRRTKNLTKRLRPGDIAVIDHEDLDRIAAEGLERLFVTFALVSGLGSFHAREFDQHQALVDAALLGCCGHAASQELAASCA